MGTIVEKDMDDWSTTVNTIGLGEFPLGLYYYHASAESLQESLSYLGNCNAVHSCWLAPFINKEDLDLELIPYDVDRFGKIQGLKFPYTPKVARIKGINVVSKRLASTPIYERHYKLTPYRSYENESRLLNFPYSFAILSDGINTPLEVHYHEVKSIVQNMIEVYCDAMVSDKGTYALWVDGLKGDLNGDLECLISSAPTEIPVSSSAYAQWSSTQKAQDNQNIRASLMQLGLANSQTQDTVNLGQKQTMFNADLGIARGMVTMGASALSRSPMGVLGGIGSAGVSGVNGSFDLQRGNITKEYSTKNLDLAQKLAIGQRNALLRDLTNTPRTMISTGSDICFSLKRRGDVRLYRYEMTEEFKQRLGDYFAMYGYKQSKVMVPNTRNRYYYNYVKTIGCNIQPKNGIPKEHLERIKAIYDSGVTTWHVDRNGVIFMDYSKDNKEVI